MIINLKYILRASILACCAPAYAVGDPDASRVEQTATAVADLYDANRIGFVHGKIKMQLIEGKARNLDDVLKNKVSHPVMADLEYTFDENQKIFTRNFKDADLRESSVKTSENTFTTQIISFRGTTNDKMTLSEVSHVQPGTLNPIRGTVIVPGGARFYKQAATVIPLSLGIPIDHRNDLSQNIDAAKKSAGSIAIKKVTEHVNLSNTLCLMVAIEFPNGTRTYWLDLDKGAIPLRIEEIIKSGNNIITINENIKHVDKIGWLPMKSSTYYAGNGKARITYISEHDFTYVPSREDFVLNVPEPTSLVNTADNVSYRPRKAWALDDLPPVGTIDALPLKSPGQQKIAHKFASEQRRKSRLSAYFIIMLFLALLLVGRTIWLRFKRQGKIY